MAAFGCTVTVPKVASLFDAPKHIYNLTLSVVNCRCCKASLVARAFIFIAAVSCLCFVCLCGSSLHTQKERDVCVRVHAFVYAHFTRVCVRRASVYMYRSNHLNTFFTVFYIHFPCIAIFVISSSFLRAQIS